MSELASKQHALHLAIKKFDIAILAYNNREDAQLREIICDACVRRFLICMIELALVLNEQLQNVHEVDIETSEELLQESLKHKLITEDECEALAELFEAAEFLGQAAIEDDETVREIANNFPLYQKALVVFAQRLSER